MAKRTRKADDSKTLTAPNGVLSMMLPCKNYFVSFTFLCLFFSSLHSRAEYPDRVNQLGITIGQNSLAGDMGDSYDSDIGLGAHYRRLATPNLSFYGDYSLSSHSQGDFKVHSLIFDISYHLLLLEKLELLPQGGLGFYYYEIKTPTSSGDGLTMGFNIGTELAFQIHPAFSFGPSFMFHLPFNKRVELNQTYVTVSGAIWKISLSFNFVF